MGHASVRPRIREFFERNPGVTLWRKDFMEYIERDLGRACTVSGLLNAISELIKTGYPIEVEERGHSWRYVPNKKQEIVALPRTNRKMFELLANTKSGAMILEDTEGEVVIVKVVDL